MHLSRRTMLKGSALAGATVAKSAIAASIHHAPVVVFDSRIPESRALAAAHPGSRCVNLEQGLATVRHVLGRPQAVIGLTRWSDWTALRGLFEEQGLRLEEEMRAPSPLSSRTHLFRWTMTAR